MSRVARAGRHAADGREQREAMDDLRRILAGRAAFYAKADLALDTSGQALDESFAALRDAWSRDAALPATAAD